VNTFRLSAAAILITLGLSGCAHSPRYVTIPCVQKDQQLPAEPPSVKRQLTGKADEDVRIIAGSAVRLRAWGRGLEQILEGCREK
jgi:hypothetical protein